MKSTFKEWNGMIQYFLKQYLYRYLLTLSNPNTNKCKSQSIIKEPYFPTTSILFTFKYIIVKSTFNSAEHSLPSLGGQTVHQNE